MTHPLVIAGALLVIFATFAVVFMINGVQLIKSASRLPLPSGEETRGRGRALQIGFGVTLTAEGVIIALVCALLAISGHTTTSHRRSRWWSGCTSSRSGFCFAEPLISKSPAGSWPGLPWESG